MYIKLNSMFKIRHNKGKWYLVNDENEKISILVDKNEPILEGQVCDMAPWDDGDHHLKKHPNWINMEKYYSNKIVKLVDLRQEREVVKQKIFMLFGEVNSVNENKLNIIGKDIDGNQYVLTFEIDKDNKMLFINTQDITTLVQVIDVYCRACKQNQLCSKCAVRALGQKIESLVVDEDNNIGAEVDEDDGDNNDLVMA